jgi:hypothetical protein
VVGRLEVSDLKAGVLCAEILLRTEHDREGDPTHGVGRLVRHDAEEGLVALHKPLEVEIHLLQGVDKDDIEPAPSVDEGLREQGSLNDGLDDQWVRDRVWDVNLVIGPREGDGLLRPTQRLRWLGVDELDLAVVLAVPSPARATLQAADDHVDRPLVLLEWVIGVACLRRGRQVTLITAIFQLLVVTSLVVTVIVVPMATSVIAAVVVAS